MKSRIVLLPLLALLLGVPAFAQLKLAVIDMQGTLLNTKEGQKAANDLKTKFGPTEQDLNKRQADLQAKQETYRKTQNTISATEKARLEREIDSTQKALTRDAEDARAEFQAAQNNLLGGIMQKMQTVLTKYATDNSITMIVDVSTQPNNLLYAVDTANISNAIIALFDAANPPGAAPAAAKPATTAAPRPPATPAPKTPGAK